MGLPGLLAPGRHRPRHRPHAGRARSRSSACATAASRARTSSTTRSRSRSPRPGVPVFALDADKLDRRAGPAAGARAASSSAGVRPLSARQLVVADERGRWRWCSARSSHDAGVTRSTERMLLCALRVKGVPPIAVEEALVDRRGDALHLTSAAAAGSAGCTADASRRARRAQDACSTRSPGSRTSWPSCSARLAAQGLQIGVPGRGGPRLLSLAELEELRDDLAERVQHARRALSDRTYSEEQYRRLIEEMLLDPAAHKWVRVAQRGHRRARLQALARAAALELHRHADGLVASGHQLRLPVSHLTWGAGPASAAAA